MNSISNDDFLKDFQELSWRVGKVMRQMSSEPIITAATTFYVFLQDYLSKSDLTTVQEIIKQHLDAILKEIDNQSCFHLICDYPEEGRHIGTYMTMKLLVLNRSNIKLDTVVELKLSYNGGNNAVTPLISRYDWSIVNKENNDS